MGEVCLNTQKKENSNIFFIFATKWLKQEEKKWKVTLFNISTSSTAKVDVDNTHTHHISLVKSNWKS